MDNQDRSADIKLTFSLELSAEDLSRACREAALEFVNHSHSWENDELGIWLTESYGRLRARDENRTSFAVWPVPVLQAIDPRLLDRILRAARDEVVDALTEIADDGRTSFVLRALIEGWVTRCEDGCHAAGWAPTGTATRLADRVLSLFAVDYLVSGEDYESAMFVCRNCAAVCFDRDQRQHGVCHRHTRALSAAAPRRHDTLPYPSLKPFSFSAELSSNRVSARGHR